MISFLYHWQWITLDRFSKFWFKPDKTLLDYWATFHRFSVQLWFAFLSILTFHLQICIYAAVPLAEKAILEL
jgi:hypothetical protein